MRWPVVVLVVLLAGCSTPSPEASVHDGFEEFQVEVSDTTGAVRGVVVDGAVVPVPDATVEVLGQGIVATTDAEGRFAMGGVPAGTHILNVSTPLHVPVHVTVRVEAGVAEPPLVKVQILRRFDQDPYMEQTQITGYINCGYSAGLSSPCILDYTQLVFPGGILPQLYGITGDVRRFVVPIGPGWQSQVTEMVWEPSTGTSQSLSVTASFYNRTSSHSYTGASGTSPVRLQMDMDPELAHPEWVGPEGQEDFLLFVNPSTTGSGLPVAAVVEQRFEMFVEVFYYGTPPEGWSFVAGDPPPF